MPPPQVFIKDGKEYCKVDGHFTYRWYDYYERALSCADGEFYDEALSDLDKAIAQRDQDIRMAKVWGMRLRDYFPHREKGVIYYSQGRDEAAKAELERSLKDEESDKAQKWLDKVRKRLMEQEEKPRSVPRIFINDLSDTKEIWTKDSPVILSGRAEDEQYISELTIGSIPYLIETSGKQVGFEKKLNLDQGAYPIKITAGNLRGGKAEREITVYVDRSGPLIIINQFDPAVRVLKGYVYDESGDLSLSVNGEKAELSGVPNLQFGKAGFSIPLKPDNSVINLVAADKLGNQTEVKVSPEEIPPGPPLRKGGENAFLQISPLTAVNKFSDIMADTEPFSIAGLLISNSQSPRITLEEMPDTVFSETVSLTGRVSGKSEIQEVLINGEPIHRAQGRILFFNHSVRLKEGENKIAVTAKEGEAEAVQEMVIIRQLPEVFKPRYRCAFKTDTFETIAFSEMGNLSAGNAFQPIFLESLTEKKRFQIKMADTAPSRFMLKGHVYTSRNGIEVVAEVVDTETLKILSTEDARGIYIDIYTESDEISVLKSVAGDLSEKFHRAFPLVKGRIFEKQGERFFCAAMENEQIRLEWPLVVGSDTRFIADADIDEQRADGVYFITLLNDNGMLPRKGDWVVTQ
jgi:tetratricopeptide (TPR) repeat protein